MTHVCEPEREAYAAMLEAAPSSPSPENVKATPSAGVEAVAVKALVWHKVGPREWRAITVFGDAVIHEGAHGDFVWRIAPHTLRGASGSEKSLETAQTVLWANYEARIRSALTPAPAPVEAGGEAVAIKRCLAIVEAQTPDWVKDRSGPYWDGYREAMEDAADDMRKLAALATPSPAGDVRRSEKGADGTTQIALGHFKTTTERAQRITVLEAACRKVVEALQGRVHSRDALAAVAACDAALSDAHQKPLTQEEGEQ